MHPNDLSRGVDGVMAQDNCYRHVPVEGRVLPKALINAQAATKHPHNCMDLRKGGRRALHAILAFYNLKTRAAIFPSREVLAREASVSIPTLHRDLAELEAREYIVRLPQKHKSVATRANAGKFWIAPISLTQKALVLLGLDKVIHSQPPLKVIDGVYIDKEHTKEVQSSLKNTIPPGTAKEKAASNPEVDPATRLPKDLVLLTELGLTKGGIFLLMKIASSAGKRLSDIVAYRRDRIASLRLNGRALFSYLRDLASAEVDFAFLANQARDKQAESEDVREAKSLQMRLHRHCDGYEIRRHGEVVGVFRAASSPEDCGRIEMADGTRPLNLRVAMTLLRGAFTFTAPQAYSY